MAKTADARPQTAQVSGGVSLEIKRRVEQGTPDAVMEAITEMTDKGFLASDFGRSMSSVSISIMQKIYPDINAVLPPDDPPQGSQYTVILSGAANGVFVTPASESSDYLENTLPFFALLKETHAAAIEKSIPYLEKAVTLNDAGVIAPYFLGLAYEKTGQAQKALAAYQKAAGLSGNSCYPAVLGIARIMNSNGQLQAAIDLTNELLLQYPDNATASHQLALLHFNARHWQQAAQALAIVLKTRKTPDLQLMYARALTELREFSQAQTALDQFTRMRGPADITRSREYLFLSARIQWEGYNNMNGALRFARRAIENEQTPDLLLWITHLLLSSNQEEDIAEGRGYLAQMLRFPSPPFEVVDLALTDALRRSSWAEAQRYLERVLDERRSEGDILAAWAVENGLGNTKAALGWAQELTEKNPDNEEGWLAYAGSLIAARDYKQAGAIVEARFGQVHDRGFRSRYYHLRSKLQARVNDTLEDLRLSLFDEPRNLPALLDIIEVYRQSGDLRRARYYLRQALAVSANDAAVRALEAEIGLN
jgi:thioredoxin-like negative regulator of GroEL